MKPQHKMLADGTEAGIAWLMANPISQAQWVMKERQEFGRLQRNNGGCRGGGHGGGTRGQGAGNRSNTNNGGRGYARGGGKGGWYSYEGTAVEHKHKASMCSYSLTLTPIDNYYYQCYDEYDEDDDGISIITSNFEDDKLENSGEIVRRIKKKICQEQGSTQVAEG